jgi:hypothetical protein
VLILPKLHRNKSLVRPVVHDRSYTRDQRADAQAILGVTELRRSESVKQALVKGEKVLTKRLGGTQQRTVAENRSVFNILRLGGSCGV